MPDMLAEVDDLSGLLGETIDTTQASIILKLATGVVQDTVRQRLLQATDTVTLMGTTESWLSLPERPVTAVISVTLDGEAITDYKRFGSRLWRADGWASCATEPSEVVVASTHGYADGDRELELARQATLVVAVGMLDNPGTATGLSIDDYREQFAQTQQSGVVPEPLAKALRKKYGRGAGMVRIG